MNDTIACEKDGTETLSDQAESGSCFSLCPNTQAVHGHSLSTKPNGFGSVRFGTVILPSIRKSATCRLSAVKKSASPKRNTSGGTRIAPEYVVIALRPEVARHPRTDAVRKVARDLARKVLQKPPTLYGFHSAAKSAVRAKPEKKVLLREPVGPRRFRHRLAAVVMAAKHRP